MAELLIDLDPALETAFARYDVVTQGILESLPWEEQTTPLNNPRRVFLAKVYSTHTFWASLWRPRKAFWQAQGFSVAKPDADWRVRFAFIDPARQVEALRQSATVESSLPGEIPAPTGPEYFEYQKAGIQFLDSHPNVLLAD